MADETTDVKRLGRILYVEPNDSYLFPGKAKRDGGYRPITTLTPPFEDMCISFNLTVYKFSRQQKDIKTAETKGYTLSWFADNNPQTKKHSFLVGTNLGNKQYLTTYYTDISSATYGTNKIIEGLGVEQIQISFESWYTPTVTIKFVDVRGSAIFGNEEAIHTQEGGITAENVFGCFFTQPYPLFKLQVKGFMGKPVTYQLTCSDFKAEYNNSTGNFEAIAQFIGYSYGLLTDIPYAYIVAAPYITPVGDAYWKDRCNSTEWALTNGRAPKRLLEFYQAIRSAVPDETDNTLETTSSADLVAKNSERDVLNELKSAYNDLASAILNIYPDGDAEDVYVDALSADGHRQIYMSCSPDLQTNRKTVCQKVCDAYIDLKTKHEEYKTNFTNNLISDDQLPKLHKGDIWETDNFDTWTTNKPTEMLGANVTIQTLKDIDWAEDGKQFQITDELAASMVKSLQDGNDLSSGAGNVIFDLRKYGSLISSRIEALSSDISDTEKQANQQKQIEERFLQKLGMEPNIGNIFKAIMCHLETFIHCILQTSQDIMDEMKAGQRSFQRLGLTGASQTDYPEGTEQVGPWPQVTGQPTRNGETVEEAAMSNTLGWVGDFSDNFLEAKLVNGIVAAILRQTEFLQNSGTTSKLTDNTFPMLPADLQQDGSPFQLATTDNTIDLLAANLANRATALFGILIDGNNVSDDLVTKIGKLDAYNYYQAYGSGIGIRQDIFERVGGGNLADIIVGITTCDDNYNSYGHTDQTTQQTKFRYENAKNLYYVTDKERHPMFVNDGDNLKYVHYYLQNKDNNNNRNGVVPSILSNNNQTPKLFHFNGNADKNLSYFNIEWSSTGNPLQPRGVLHQCSSYDVISSKPQDTGSAIDLTQQLKTYQNPSMFCVITDEESINTLETIKDKAAGGSVTVGAYTTALDLNDFIDKIWWIGKKEIVKYYARHIDGTCMGHFAEKNHTYTRDKTFVGVGHNIQLRPPLLSETGSVRLTDEGEWLGSNNEPLSDLCAFSTIIQYEGGFGSRSTSPQSISLSSEFHGASPNSGDIHTPPSMMGTAFYYCQNSIADEKIKRKAKALLFLQSFAINKNVIPRFLQSTNQGGLESVPYFYLLLLGGLLWRSRYIYENNKDVFITSAKGCSTKPLYRNGVEYTLFFDGLDCYIGQINNISEYTVPVNKIFGKTSTKIADWWPDACITNRLVSLFEEWVDSKWPTLQEYELTYTDNNGRKKACLARDFIDYSCKFKSECEKAANAGADGHETVKIAMKNIFPEIWSKYGFAQHLGEDNNNIILVYDPNDATINSIMKELSAKRVVVATANRKQTSYNHLSTGTELKIPANVFKKYVSSFVEELQHVTDANNNASLTANLVSSDNIDAHTLKIAVYYYIKSLWDKWLVHAPMDRYNVENFFQKNFIFMDSFYRNTSKELKLNCKILVDLFDSTDYEKSLFSYINDVISKHRCLFMATPDFIAFKGNGGESDVETMQNLFRPVPYISQRHALEIDNKFVIIYIHEPAKHLYEGKESEYRWDGFDIWSNKGEGDANIPDIFKQTLNGNGDVTQVGYHVPSFGVAVNRQNNTIFKNIRVNMQNPVQTEAAIVCLSNILSNANGKPAVTYHGQDIYNVFSNYSYTCEVEMMGNAQIAPLMYFQLLNLPMWRGAYMIYNVQHVMTPGNMTTTFKGMKLSSTPTPWASSYLTYYTPGQISSEGNIGSYTGIDNGSSIIINSNYTKVGYNAAKDHFNDSKNRLKKVYNGQCLTELQQVFNALYEEIELLNQGWNIFLISAGRQTGDNGNHSVGEAMDIVIQRNGKACACSSSMPELFIVTDMLLRLHQDVVGRIGIEYTTQKDNLSSANFFKPTEDEKAKISMLHIESNRKISNKGNKSVEYRPDHPVVQVWLQDPVKRKSYSAQHVIGGTFLASVPKPLKEIAYKFAYKNGGCSTVRHFFRNYTVNDSLLHQHFSDMTDVTSGVSTANSNQRPADASKGKSNNCNPGNVKNNKAEKWVGEIGRDSRYHVIFDSWANGFRCLFIVLHNTYLTRGRTSIQSIFNTWNGQSGWCAESSAATYCKNMPSFMKQYGVAGITANTSIFAKSLKDCDRKTLIAFAKGVCRQEQGYAGEDSDIINGLNMALNYVK